MLHTTLLGDPYKRKFEVEFKFDYDGKDYIAYLRFDNLSGSFYIDDVYALNVEDDGLGLIHGDDKPKIIQYLEYSRWNEMSWAWDTSDNE